MAPRCWTDPPRSSLESIRGTVSDDERVCLLQHGYVHDCAASLELLAAALRRFDAHESLDHSIPEAGGGKALPTDMNAPDHAHARLRRRETALAWFSLALLVFYVPVETYLSRGDLTSPGYIVDVIAMALLLAGGVHSLHARPALAIAPLCGAWGWCACLAWRCYFMRVISRERGLGIYPPETAWQDGVLRWVLVMALIAFGLSLLLAWQGVRLSRRGGGRGALSSPGSRPD